MRGLPLLMVITLLIVLAFRACIGIIAQADDSIVVNPAPVPVKLIDPDLSGPCLLVDPVPEHDKNALAKAIDWSVEHADCLNGWSLTGYSRTTLDDNYNLSSIKLGLISGRMDYSHHLYRDPSLDLPQERHRPRPVIFGFLFTKEF